MVMAVHGTTVIFPSTGYDGHANLVALEKEKYVVIHVKFFYTSKQELMYCERVAYLSFVIEDNAKSFQKGTLVLLTSAIVNLSCCK